MSRSREEDEAYLKSVLPMGFRFKPLDSELVIYYLKRKVNKKPLPPNRIWEVQLYNYDPVTLTGMYKNTSSNGVVNEWYFFTPRDRKYQNGSRPDRRAGAGYWKATASNKHIQHNGKLVGYKKTLVFYWGKQPKGDKTNWLMHEYVLSDTPARERISNCDMLLNEWVLCRVYNKQKKAKPNLAATPEDEAAIIPFQMDQTQKQENGIAEAEAAIIPFQMDQTQKQENGIAEAEAAIIPFQMHQTQKQENGIAEAEAAIIPFQMEQTQRQENGIPPPQFVQHFQDEGFNMQTQQTYPVPSNDYNNAYGSSTFGGLPPLPESHCSAPTISANYGNFVASTVPVSSIPPDQFHYSGPQKQKTLDIDFSEADSFLLTADFGLENI
ncbi:hypothetical protein PTKIN_Ptkin16aG0520800 [Pterospermum kingtungense]